MLCICLKLVEFDFFFLPLVCWVLFFSLLLEGMIFYSQIKNKKLNKFDNTVKINLNIVGNGNSTHLLLIMRCYSKNQLVEFILCRRRCLRYFINWLFLRGDISVFFGYLEQVSLVDVKQKGAQFGSVWRYFINLSVTVNIFYFK